MPEDNYPSASEIVRNISSLPGRFEVLEERGKFRIVRFAPIMFGGYEFWVVNEKGFLWEGADTLGAARSYLNSGEARAYQARP